MSTMLLPAARPLPAKETVVTLATEHVAVPGLEGTLAGTPRLGPGFVREHDTCGRIKVHWMERDFDAWMDPADLAVLSADGRLISIFSCAAAGPRLFERHQLVTNKGLQYNWIVELFPQDIVRTERSDGAAWTFNWLPILNRVERIRTVDMIPAEDADAEALVVAELAIGLRS